LPRPLRCNASRSDREPISVDDMGITIAQPGQPSTQRMR
jgi:hypothetical protein